MRKSRFLKEIMNRVMLVGIIGFVSVSVSLAQETIAEKIDYAKALFGGYMSSSKEEQESKVIGFYEKCSKEQQDAILSYMVQAITDSLNADNKQFAMDRIDYYRMIASPDDEYLGSLVVTEGRYYYENMDAQKLMELTDYLNDIAAKSSLDYSSELSELNRMMEEVVHGCDDLIGYWVADCSDYEKRDIFFVDIYKDDEGGYHVDIFINCEFIYSGFFEHSYNSVDCQQSSPNSISFYWSSEKMSGGKEELATFLRSGVRSVSNSIIGEVARSNTYSFGTTVLGSVGAVAGEAILNTFIDELSISKKTIQIISGEIDFVNKNILSALLFFDDYKFRSDNSGVEKNNRQLKINLIRYKYDDDYVKNNIAFISSKWLTQLKALSRKERKIFYEKHPEVRKTVRRISNIYLPWGTYHPFKTMRAFNREQVEKLKEYNLTH
ncbi:MAG: hypothetical protein IJS63_03290 [Bacteroidaceae bacterium]|nr:hypothetical protein [Bacteroidaceae bacterium]